MKFRNILPFVLGALIFGYGSIAFATGAYPVVLGGTGVSTIAATNLVVGNGTSPIYTVATTSASCSGSASCASFTIIGSSPVTITDSGGAAYPFTPGTFGATLTSATSTAINDSAGLMASSTSWLGATNFNGNVGISTSTPAAPLSVMALANGASLPNSLVLDIGSTTATGVTSSLLREDANGTLSIGNGGIPVWTTNGGQLMVTGQTQFGNNSFIPSVNTGIFWNSPGNFSPGIERDSNSDIEFIPNTTVPGSSSYTYYAPTGAWGIGSSSPNAKLSIHAVTAGTTYLNLFQIGSSTASATTTLFNVANTGNVGVGTTSPFSQLSVQALTTSNTTPLFAFATSSTAASPTAFEMDQNGNLSLNNGAALNIGGSALNFGAVLQAEGGNAYFGTEANVPENIYLRRNNTTVGGFSNSNGLFNIFGGTATQVDFRNTLSISQSASGAFSIGSSSPSTLNKFSINLTSLDGVAQNALFVASSTPTATTTLLSLTNGGQLSTSESAPATSTGQLIDWKNSPNQVLLQMGTSAFTIGFNNASTSGMTKRIIVCNPGASAGALTWATSIPMSWAGGAVPAQTTTANQCDAYSFIVTGATSTQKIFGAASLGFQ